MSIELTKPTPETVKTIEELVDVIKFVKSVTNKTTGISKIIFIFISGQEIEIKSINEHKEFANAYNNIFFKNPPVNKENWESFKKLIREQNKFIQENDEKIDVLDTMEQSSVEILNFMKAKGALELLDKIEKVEVAIPRIGDDPYEYRFHIRGVVIKVPTNKMLKHLTFAHKYLAKFGRLPGGDLSESGVWGHFVNALAETGLLFYIYDIEENDESYASEMFLNIIRRFNKLEKGDFDRYKRNKKILFSKDEKLYLPAEIVKIVLEEGQLKIKLKRLNELIKPYKIGTGSFRFGKEKSEVVYCWIFNQKLINDPVISIDGTINIQEQEGDASES
jgi:hypothetical protein